MSDYLHNLAAKTLRLTEVIQPRLGSLFEPPSVIDGPPSGHFASNVETAPGEHLADERSLAAPLTAQAPLRNPVESRSSSMLGVQQPPGSQQLQPETGVDQFMAASSGQLTSRQPLPSIVPPWVDRRSASVSRAATPSAAQTIFTLTPAPLGPPEAGRPVHTQTLQQPHPDPRGLVLGTAGPQADVALSGETAASDKQAALAPHVQRRPEEQGGLRAAPLAQNTGYIELASHRAQGPLPPATVVAQQHELPLLEPAVSAPTTPITTPEPGPTIKITIGRVDVRAIMPAPPAPRPTLARPRPSLTLEDYLKQREGRRR
jgi:hypothetical protein